MDWISVIVSSGAVAISTLCAAMGYRRTHRIVEPRVRECAEAITDLRTQNASLLARVRKLEAAGERKIGDPDGA
jgi:uncharacterized protein (DUF1810 family)